MFERCKSIKASQVAKQGGAVVAGSLLLLGMGGGVASAHSQDVSPNGGDKQQLQHSEKGGGNQSNSLVGVDHNQIPIQACHDQVPVNVLGVQVPVQDVDANLGLGLLGDGKAGQKSDKSCHQPAAQQN